MEASIVKSDLQDVHTVFDPKLCRPFGLQHGCTCYTTNWNLFMIRAGNKRDAIAFSLLTQTVQLQ